MKSFIHKSGPLGIECGYFQISGSIVGNMPPKNEMCIAFLGFWYIYFFYILSHSHIAAFILSMFQKWNHSRCKPFFKMSSSCLTSLGHLCLSNCFFSLPSA